MFNHLRSSQESLKKCYLSRHSIHLGIGVCHCRDVPAQSIVRDFDGEARQPRHVSRPVEMEEMIVVSSCGCLRFRGHFRSVLSMIRLHTQG